MGLVKSSLGSRFMRLPLQMPISGSEGDWENGYFPEMSNGSHSHGNPVAARTLYDQVAKDLEKGEVKEIEWDA